MSTQACGTAPILCAHLLRKVDQALIDLLCSLTPGQWGAPTIAAAWTVRDVVSHLLDTALRKVSLVRDCCHVDAVEIRSPEDVIALVNRLNREGVTVCRRLSPRVLIDLTEMACTQSAEFHESLDPFSPAAFAVSWACEEQSLNWFDTARELTERWHQQQQIRMATNRPGIMVRELYHPVLDCFLRGLSHLYRDVYAPAGTTVVVEISGECGGQWILLRSSSCFHKGQRSKFGPAAAQDRRRPASRREGAPSHRYCRIAGAGRIPERINAPPPGRIWTPQPGPIRGRACRGASI